MKKYELKYWEEKIPKEKPYKLEISPEAKKILKTMNLKCSR
jgi:hypothetical protein